MFGTHEVVWSGNLIVRDLKELPVLVQVWLFRQAFAKKKKKNKKTRQKTIRQTDTLWKLNKVIYYRVASGAILGNGNRKRKLFSFSVGVVPVIFLFLEQFGPSCAVQARTCCEDFRGCSADNWRTNRNSQNVWCPYLTQASIRWCLLEYCFCRKLLQLEWSTVSK